MKSGRTGNAKSERPDSSRSTERPVLIAQIAPAFCNSRINSMHCVSRTGSLTLDTRVPSKSTLSSLIGECIQTNLGIDFQRAMSRLISGVKTDNEIGLRIGDGTASEGVAVARP